MIWRLLGRKKGSTARYLPYTGDLNKPFAPINVIHSPVWWSDEDAEVAKRKVSDVFPDYEFKWLKQKE